MENKIPLLIGADTGSETSKDSYAKCYLLHCTSEKEMFIGNAAKSSHTGVSKAGAHASYAATEGIREEIGGRWTSGGWQVPDGTVLKITATVKRGWGSILETAQMYIKVRKDGPLQTVKVPLIDGPRSTLTEAKFYGRFDILTPEEVFHEDGIEVPEKYVPLHSEANRSSVFIVETQSSEKAPRRLMEAKVVGSKGNEVVVRSRVRRRRLKIPKNRG